MNILLIQTLRLGDALQMVPIIRGLKEYFPGCRVSVLTSSVGKWVFESDPAVDAVHVLDKQRIAELVQRGMKRDILAALELLDHELRPLWSQKWDWVINFSFSYPSALLSFLFDAVRRSGFVVNTQRQYLSREKWFAHSLASFVHRRYSNFNWVDINRKIIGLPSVPGHPLLRPRAEDLEKASEHMKSIGFKGRTIVGINPGASGAYKMWPVENFGRVGRSLVEDHDFRILVFGGARETGLGRMLKAHIGEKAEDLSGRTTLDELAAYLHLCHVLVTNDTGPMHLAYSVGTPVIGLFFNSHFVETGPYGKGHVAVHPDLPCFPCLGPAKCEKMDCLSSISPEDLEKILFNTISPDAPSSRSGTPAIDSVKVHVADFDPWGVLEWFPLDRPPLTMPVLERILLRDAWLYHCDMGEEDEKEDTSQLRRSMERYRPPDNRDRVVSALAELSERLLAFKEKLKRAQGYASRIHMEATRARPDISLISSLGGMLGRAEDEALRFETETPVGFIAELLKVYLEGIELSHFTELSRKTVSVYYEVMGFTDLVIAGAEKAKRALRPDPIQTKPPSGK